MCANCTAWNPPGLSWRILRVYYGCIPPPLRSQSSSELKKWCLPSVCIWWDPSPSVLTFDLKLFTNKSLAYLASAPCRDHRQMSCYHTAGKLFVTSLSVCHRPDGTLFAPSSFDRVQPHSLHSVRIAIAVGCHYYFCSIARWVEGGCAYSWTLIGFWIFVVCCLQSLVEFYGYALDLSPNSRVW